MKELTVSEIERINGGDLFDSLGKFWDDLMDIIANKIPAIFSGIVDGWNAAWND